MKKIGIFYGSSTGTTQGIAETIASKLGVPASDVIDVIKSESDKHTVDDGNRGGERIIFCRYLTNDGTTGILDIFVYDTHAIAECIAIRLSITTTDQGTCFFFQV